MKTLAGNAERKKWWNTTSRLTPLKKPCCLTCRAFGLIICNSIIWMYLASLLFKMPINNPFYLIYSPKSA
jgi:hypothetical protein